MKASFFICAIFLAACNDSGQAGPKVNNGDSSKTNSRKVQEKNEKKQETVSQPAEPKQDRTYANTRFRNVTVTGKGGDSYVVQGEGQIFEASFGWVVEDGHNELKKGYEMTDAGAPEWGKFRFTVDVKKQRPNSTLTLILYESSAKDGSRQHLLPIVLN